MRISGLSSWISAHVTGGSGTSGTSGADGGGRHKTAAPSWRVSGSGVLGRLSSWSRTSRKKDKGAESGSTAGGVPVARMSSLPSPSSQDAERAGAIDEALEYIYRTHAGSDVTAPRTEGRTGSKTEGADASREPSPYPTGNASQRRADSPPRTYAGEAAREAGSTAGGVLVARMSSQSFQDAERAEAIDDLLEYIYSTHAGSDGTAPRAESGTGSKTEGADASREPPPVVTGNASQRRADSPPRTYAGEAALEMAERAVRAIPEIGADDPAAGAGEVASLSGPAFVPRPAHSGGEGEGEVAALVAGQRDIDPAPVRAWLAARGIETVANSGSGMNCLLISLLQHATGRYGKDAEPELALQAQTCREWLEEQHPEIESLDRMLHADEPAVKSALAYINARYDTSLDVHWVEPHAEGYPVRWLRSDTGKEPVAVIRFGRHFEALRAVRADAPSHARTPGSSVQPAGGEPGSSGAALAFDGMAARLSPVDEGDRRFDARRDPAGDANAHAGDPSAAPPAGLGMLHAVTHAIKAGIDIVRDPDKRFLHGFGITSTTASAPIRSDTWTPEAKPYRGFTYDKDIAPTRHFSAAALPPGSAHPALGERLEQIAQDKGLTDGEAARLAQSIRHAFGLGGDPARDALAALEALLDTSLIDGVRAVGFRSTPRAAEADRAWTLARHIVAPPQNDGGDRPLHDGIGVRLLGKLALPSLLSRPTGTPRALIEQDEAMLGECMAVFLRASRAAVAEAGGADARGCDAASVFALGRLGEATRGRGAARDWPGRNGVPVPQGLSPAQKALLAVKNQLTAWSDHVGNPATAGTPFALGKAAVSAMKPFATTIETREPAREPARVAVTAPPEEPAMTHPLLEASSSAVSREAPPEFEIVSRLNASTALSTLFDTNTGLLRGARRADLFEAFAGLRQPDDPAQASRPEYANKLSGPETVMLVHALDLVFGKDFDPSRGAHAALQALQRTNLLDGLRQVGRPEPAPAPEGADEAWRLAQEIVRIPGGVGKSLIGKLTPASAWPRDPRTHASVADKERIVLDVFLNASQRVQQEAIASAGRSGGRAPSLKSDPASIFGLGRLGDVTRGRTAENWPGRDGSAVPAGLTVAQKALLAVRDELRALDEHAQDPARLATPFMQGTHGCRFAMPMIRNGMLTDAARDLDGKPSEFRLTEARLTKGVGKHVDRAMRNPTGWSKFKADLRRIVLPFKGKSPFFTHNRLSEELPGRGMGVVNQGGTHAARAQADMMDAVSAAIDAMPDLKRSALRDDGAGDAALRLLVRSEVVRQVKAQALFLTRHATPKRLLPFATDKVIRAVLDKLVPSKSTDASRVADDASLAAAASAAGLRAALRERIGPVVDEENREALTPRTLLRWAADAGGPDSPHGAARMAADPAAAPGWQAFGKGFTLATQGSEAPIEMASFKGKERKDVANVIADLVAVEELGSGFAFDSTGNVVVATKGVQDTVTAVLSGFVAKLHVDLGGGLVRTVRFESSVTTDRSQLRVSVLTLKKVETGAGGSFGTVPVPLKGSVDLGYAYDVVHQEGAVLGFPRNLTGGSPGDRGASVRKAALVRLLVNHAAVGGAGGDYLRPGNEEDRASLIKSAFHAFGDDLSIGYFEQSRSDHTTTGSVGAALGIEGLSVDAFGHPVTGGVSGGVGGRYQGVTMRYRDRLGFLRTERDTAQSLWHGTLQGSATGAMTLDAIDPQPQAALSNVLGMSVPLYSVSADVWRKGLMYQSSAIVQDGEEHATSYATQTYQSPADFLRDVREKLPEMTEGKSRKFFAAEYEAAPAVRADRVALEAAYLKEFAAWAVSQRDTTSTPQIYYEFDAHVKTSNQLRAYEYVMARSGNPAEAKRARESIETIHADPRYREAHFLTYPQNQQEGRTTGVNGVFGLTYAASDNRTQQALTFT